MIKVENGTVTIEGSHAHVMADLSTLVHSLYHVVCIKNMGMNPEKAKQDILHAVEQGFLTKEEVREKARQAMQQNPAILLAMLADIMTGKDDK